MSGKRYAFDMEMLTVASLFWMRVVELPVRVHQSVLFSMRSIIRMLVATAGIVYQAQKGDGSRGVTWLASWLRNPNRMEERVRMSDEIHSWSPERGEKKELGF